MKYTFICSAMQSAVALSGALTLLSIGKVCTQFITKSICMCVSKKNQNKNNTHYEICRWVRNGRESTVMIFLISRKNRHVPVKK